jgi:hypothetical protein
MDEPFQLRIRLRSPVIFFGFHLPTLGGVPCAQGNRRTTGGRDDRAYR